MRVGRSTTRRRFIFLLVAINGFVLYLNFKWITLDSLKAYSEDFTANFRNLRLLDSNYLDEWTGTRNHEAKERPKEGARPAFVWEKVENLHLALPAYEKMRHTLSRLQDYQFLFSKRVKQLGISQEMLTFKSIAWEGDVDRLKDIYIDVLETNRSIKIGLLAGGISSQTICPERACLHIDHVKTWFETILQTTVTLHNAALPFASSDYFAWCAEPHLDVDDMDIIVWELATEDFNMQSTIDKQRYDHAAQPQELLTRWLKSLPSKPFLMYVNFLSAENIRNRDCVNSEYYAGRHLCRHYNITSVSWCAAVCQSLWQLGFTPAELIHSGNLLSERAHEQAAFFTINFLKRVLKSVAVHHMNLTRTNEEYLHRLIFLHDDFVANSKLKVNPKGQSAAQLSIDANMGKGEQIKRSNSSSVVNGSSNGDLNSNSKTNASHASTGESGVNKSLRETRVVNYTTKLVQFKNRTLTMKSRFPARWIYNSVCLPLSQPQFVPHHALSLLRNDGWEESISDRENWFTSTGSQQILEVVLDIAPASENRSSVIALAAMACDYCGQALAWLDQEFDHAVLVGGKWPGHAFRVVELMTDVVPGRHVFSLKSLEDKPFKLAAVMTAHKDKLKF
ncbi:uncharacterized protein [Diadema setosum]|uniref:uncharacterized protein n=1 Tax=Diadema setosum TaxID=31175 RepID=UPI003B3B30C0